jgi:hypothetical protein
MKHRQKNGWAIEACARAATSDDERGGLIVIGQRLRSSRALVWYNARTGDLLAPARFGLSIHIQLIYSIDGNASAATGSSSSAISPARKDRSSCTPTKWVEFRRIVPAHSLFHPDPHRHPQSTRIPPFAPPSFPSVFVQDIAQRSAQTSAFRFRSRIAANGPASARSRADVLVRGNAPFPLPPHHLRMPVRPPQSLPHCTDPMIPPRTCRT